MSCFNKKLELLAPVGSFDGLKAAIANGADAIYVGGPSFGARACAAFSHEELVEVIEFCHLYNIRAYVTINTTVFDDELRELEHYVHFLYTNGADAVIISDFGIAKLVRTLYPDFEIHISTQAHVHNSSAVEFFKEFGVARVVAARENSLAEIRAMSAVGLEVEVFVHGALCFCYSGQCLMSSMFGGRSGNRGACAQPCRHAYDLVNLETNKTLESDIGNYLISPRDLNTASVIGQLIEAGATSFKIEGRLKKPEYVAAVTRAYRTAIDQYLTTGKINLAAKLVVDMEAVFSRTFTKGFLYGESGRNWLGADRPGHRGTLVGIVVNVKGNRATVKLKDELHLHDGVRFVGDDEFGMQVQKLFVDRLDEKSALAGQQVDLICNFTPTVSMKVYKTSSKKLADELAVEKMPKILIDGEVLLQLDAPLKLRVTDELGNVVSGETEELVIVAENTGLTVERLKKQITKTGSTPFEFDQLEVVVQGQGTIPISAINQLRRTVLAELELKRKSPYGTRTLSNIELAVAAPTVRAEQPRLTATVRNLDQLQAVLFHDEITEIYYQHFPTLEQAVDLAKRNGKVLIPQIPRIVADNLVNMVKEKLKALNLATVLVGEYGMLQALAREFEVRTDHGFNTNNELTLTAQAEFGVASSTLSHELTGSKIRKLAKNAVLPLELIVYMKTPLMITKHCPLKTHYQKDAPCRGKYCKIPHGLRDRKGEILPIIRTGRCNVEILDSQTLVLLEQLPLLSDIGIQRFRLEFTTETGAEINEILTAFITDDKKWLSKQKYTLGHYHKGVL